MLFRIKGAPVSPRFLPNYFKKIGVVLIVLTIMFRLMPVYHTIHESFKIIFEKYLFQKLLLLKRRTKKKQKKTLSGIPPPRRPLPRTLGPL